VPALQPNLKVKITQQAVRDSGLALYNKTTLHTAET